MWVRSLSWEDPLEGGMVTHSSILPWRTPWAEKPMSDSPWGHKELDMTEAIEHKQHNTLHSISSIQIRER